MPHWLSLSTATLIADVIQYVGFAAVIPLYSIEAVASFMLFALVAELLIPLVSLKYELGISLASNRSIAIDNYAWTILVTVIMTALLGILIVIIDNYFYAFAFRKSVLMTFIGVFALFRINELFLLKLSLVSRVICFKIIVKITQPILQYSFATLFNESGLIYGRCLSVIVGALLGISYILYIIHGSGYSLRNRLPQVVSLCSTNKDFVKYVAPGQMLKQVQSHLPKLLILPTYGELIFSSYSLVLTYVLGPLAALTTSISDLYLKEIGDKGNLKWQLFLKYLSILTVTLTPFVFLVLIFGGDIFSLFLGVEWSHVGKLSSIMAIPLVLVAINAALYNSMYSSKSGQKTALYIDLIFIPYLLMLFCFFRHLAAQDFIRLWAVGLTVFNLVVLGANSYYAKNT